MEVIKLFLSLSSFTSGVQQDYILLGEVQKLLQSLSVLIRPLGLDLPDLGIVNIEKVLGE